MSFHRSRGGYGHAQHSQRQPHPQSRDDFYDDRRSHSRSPDRRYNSPYARNNDYYDSPRPHGLAQDSEHGGRFRNRSPDRRHDRSNDYRSYQSGRRSPSPRRGREYYDRDRPQNSDRRSRSRSREYDRPSSRGRPSKEIIMEGLAPHLTENDISAELRQHYHIENLEDVRVIRDRQTRQSREFGFLRFTTLQQAESFMDQNYPFIYLYGESNQPQGDNESAKVRIAFGRERKDNRVEEGDWICTACNINNYATRVRCFRCQAHRADTGIAAEVKPANIGDNDVSPDNIPSQFLLFRGLETSVSEELLSKGVAKLNKPSGPAGQSNSSSSKKGAKVASTTGDANLGAREGTLCRILLVRDRRSNESWRFGFAEYASIEDAQAALTRFNSFDRFTIASKQVLVSYIHAGVFVPVLNPTPSTERFSFRPLGNPSIKLAYWDEAAYVTELSLSSSEPELTDTKAGSAAADSEGLKSTKDTDKNKKRKAQADATATGTKKAAPSHLQFWSNRHAELHGIAQKGDSTQDGDSASETGAPPTQSYSDPSRSCCYLCMRQFTNSAEVNKHERLSDLHQKNLLDLAKVKKALGKLEKHGISQASTSEYRDRAKERRKIFGVVNKKGEQVRPSKEAKASSDEDETPVQSKGASLLSKMGYTAGQGLGATGTGMTAPIQQDIYVAGVGLGAEGGKLGDATAEAEKNTRGDYSAFAESVRQGARERYARM